MRVLRPESYWYREVGKVISVDQVRALANPIGSQQQLLLHTLC